MLSQLANVCHKSSSLVINLVLRLYNPYHGKSNTWHVGNEQSFSKGAMHVTRFLVPRNDKRWGYFLSKKTICYTLYSKSYIFTASTTT